MLPVGTTNEDSQGGVSRPTRLSPRLKVRVQALKRLALHTFVSRGYAGCRQLLQAASCMGSIFTPACSRTLAVSFSRRSSVRTATGISRRSVHCGSVRRPRSLHRWQLASRGSGGTLLPDLSGPKWQYSHPRLPLVLPRLASWRSSNCCSRLFTAGGSLN